MISEDEIKALLANTKSLFANIHHFDCSFDGINSNSTRGAAITYADLLERRADFVSELRNSIVNWVYSNSKFSSMLDAEMKVRGGDMPNAASRLVELAKSKFRKGYPNGQFGELLLFNFLQHFFEAPPLLRKMPFTTAPSVERHGADAIHVGLRDGLIILYLGEAKTYSSKYKFVAALESAVESILAVHEKLYNELDLYVLDEFIESPFIEFAKKVKRNEVTIQVELVSLISYAETGAISGANEVEIKEKLREIVQGRMKAYDKKVFANIPPNVVSRMHFIVLPFWDLDSLLSSFES